MFVLELKSLNKHYGSFHVLKNINLQVQEGEFVVLVGPSGCGKSTLMRTIAGLEKSRSGGIEIYGKDVSDTVPKERDVAMVFQSYALYPHMSAGENIGFGMKISRLPKEQIQTRVLDAARTLKIDHLLHRKPKELSGGQRQRVAIGRAIVRNPKIFLFDEPLSNLDAALRMEMRVELAKLHRHLGATMIYVTHDQVEAMTMADRIVVMNDGGVEQVGAPLDLFNQPKNRFVAGFLGQPSAIFIKLEGYEIEENRMFVKFAGTSVAFDQPAQGSLPPIEIGLRPDFFEFERERPDIEPTAEVVEQLGDVTLAYVKLPDGQNFTVSLPGQMPIKPGDKIPLRIACKKPLVFDSHGQNLYA